ncbi:Spermidine/spermine N-acetyltransferase [Golovinomyces cichoracearum]|uniref:Spermidine/spermine N-acetyltransferase n=1 Tax=Golovinomyces cichoracearum TaxID=62708 RepID=A0A420JBP3_9PEZI|nr:Spermidine/spermine N-acetyltransferase [Golovinomyces cichoracearum]
MTSNPPDLKIKLRLADLNDSESIRELAIHTFSITFGYSLSIEDLHSYLANAYSAKSISAEISDPAMTTIVAENSNRPTEIIGFAQLLRGSSNKESCLRNIENSVEMHRLYVHPKYHGKSVGTKLIKRLEQNAKDEGFSVIWLGVWEDHPVARDIYERWGYVRVGEHPFRMGDCVQVDWILIKQL